MFHDVFNLTNQSKGFSFWELRYTLRLAVAIQRRIRNGTLIISCEVNQTGRDSDDNVPSNKSGYQNTCSRLSVPKRKTKLGKGLVINYQGGGGWNKWEGHNFFNPSKGRVIKKLNCQKGGSLKNWTVKREGHINLSPHSMIVSLYSKFQNRSQWLLYNSTIK